MTSAPRFHAAVFDLDGTLVDNLRAHLLAWQAMGERLGMPVDPATFERDYSGRKNAEIFPALLGRELPAEEIERLSEEKEALYRELYAPKLAPVPGLVPFLDRLQSMGVALAIASAGPKKNRDMVVDGLGIRSRFATIVGGEDANRGKPHPDLFLEAARRIGVEPAHCLAFEDAIHGVTSAKTAGMEVIGLLTTTAEHELRAAGASVCIRDWTGVPEAFLSRFERR